MSDWAEILGGGIRPERYKPIVECLDFDPSLSFLYTMFNGITAVACIVIGCALWSRRRIIVDMNMPAKVLFASFFVLCGLARAGLVLTLFASVYMLEATILAAGAGVSLVTAIYTVRALWFEPSPRD